MANEKVLVVDDTEIVCAAFERELGQEGYEVDSALNGDVAVGKAKLKKYDLIFVDLVMPGMDGIETCKAIKKVSPDSTLIFMTGAKERFAEKEFEFIEAGGKTYYLYKPFGTGEILEVTKKALAERG